MKSYPPEKIRNVAVVGHGGAGKTTLAEALLHRAGAIPRMGSVNDGTTALDYLPEEHKRTSTISLSLGQFEYNGHKINLIDTPGFADFEGEVAAGLRAADGLVVVVGADTGVGVGAEIAWRRAREAKMPRAVVVTGMDKENADGMAAFRSIKEHFGKKITAFQIPIGNGADFSGVVDVLRDQALTFQEGGADKGDVPASHREEVDEARASLTENAAESSEELLNKFFEEGTLTQDELVHGLHDGIAHGDLYPVFFVSATEEKGISQVLDGIVDLLPSPADRPLPRVEGGELAGVNPDGPLAAQIFKTASETHVGEIYFVRTYSGKLTPGMDAYNTTRDHAEKLSQLYATIGHDRVELDAISAGDIGLAVKLKGAHTGDTLSTKGSELKISRIPFPVPSLRCAVTAVKAGEEDKMGAGLNRLVAEDPTIAFIHDEETHEAILAGLGDTHLELVTSRLKERVGVEVELRPPRIAFRETIRGKSTVHARHKKQSGGRGQFADVHIRMEPNPEGEGFTFENEIVGGAIPGRFIPAVEKGIQEALPKGAIAGYPMVDVKCTLFDGAFHNVDSSEAAFKIAGSMAFKQAAVECKPTILEPYWDLKIIVPQDYMGDVMGDISQRRGRVQGMEADGAEQIINAQVPEAEMQRYTLDLRQMTQGRGRFEASPSHYEELPRDEQEKVIAAAKAEEEVAK